MMLSSYIQTHTLFGAKQRPKNKIHWQSLRDWSRMNTAWWGWKHITQACTEVSHWHLHCTKNIGLCCICCFQFYGAVTSAARATSARSQITSRSEWQHSSTHGWIRYSILFKHSPTYMPAAVMLFYAIFCFLTFPATQIPNILLHRSKFTFVLQNSL